MKIPKEISLDQSFQNCIIMSKYIKPNPIKNLFQQRRPTFLRRKKRRRRRRRRRIPKRPSEEEHWSEMECFYQPPNEAYKKTKYHSFVTSNKQSTYHMITLHLLVRRFHANVSWKHNRFLSKELTQIMITNI